MYILRILFFLIICLPAIAQTGKENAIQAMKDMAFKYRSVAYLSFDVHYYCFEEGASPKYVDSLNGQVKLHHDKYWYSLDSTESVMTDSGFVVTLFKEDKLMYLARSSRTSMAANPVMLLDSMLMSNKDISFNISTIGNDQVISLDLAPGASFKKIRYYINRNSGLLTKVQMLVRASELYDPAVKERMNGEDKYVSIEALYTNYKTGLFNETVFCIGNYIKQVGKEYAPAAPYDSYKIFAGGSKD